MKITNRLLSAADFRDLTERQVDFVEKAKVALPESRFGLHDVIVYP